MTKETLINCIDYRFPQLINTFLENLGLAKTYYQCTCAGSSLSITYNEYCKLYGGGCTCDFKKTNCKLQKGVLTNFEISTQLASIEKIFLMNHQDCGAFKVFLPTSNYPKKLGDNNAMDIKIQTESMLLTLKKLESLYPSMEIILYLIDINGSVAQYISNKWKIVYIGDGQNPLGLWWGYSVGDIYKM